MPIYEYSCQGCGADVEVWQKISEKPKKVCPECGAHKLERQISATTFHLKGSGWYVTDYANKGSSGGAKAKSAPKKSESSSSSASSSSTSSDD